MIPVEYEDDWSIGLLLMESNEGKNQGWHVLLIIDWTIFFFVYGWIIFGTGTTLSFIISHVSIIQEWREMQRYQKIISFLMKKFSSRKFLLVNYFFYCIHSIYLR